MNTRSRTICPLSSDIPITAERGSAEKFCPHWFGAAERWGMTMYPLVKSTTGMSRPAAAAKASGFGHTKRTGKGSNTDFPFESERTGKGYSDLHPLFCINKGMLCC